ncbi:MAG: hypothetical protein M3Y12_07455 [Bacteroidota bacterium]|nr:hypothetical protein [Bacteroidota bacterium]
MLPDASSSGLLATLREVVLEPTFLLLLVACGVYFVLGRAEEAITHIATLLLALLLLAAQRLFGLAPVPLALLGGCGLAALLGAGWVEVRKAVRR